MKHRVKTSALLLFSVLFSGCALSGSFDGINSGEAPVPSSTLCSQHVTAFCEDGNGFVWIGTNHGLARYDGNEYLTFFTEESPDRYSYPEITSLYTDTGGRVWVTGINGVDAYNGDGTFRNYPVRSRGDYASSVFETFPGDIFIDCGQDIFRYVPERDTLELFIQDTRGKAVADRDNHIWVIGNAAIGMYDAISGSLLWETTIEGGMGMDSAILDGNSNVWIAGTEGPVLFSTEQRTELELPSVIRKSDIVKADIRDIYPYGASSLLFLTDRGMFVYNYKDDLLLGEADSNFPFFLPGFEKVTAFFEDSASNLWFGSANEGFRIKKSKAGNNRSLYRELENCSIAAMANGSDGDLFILTVTPDRLLRYSVEENTYSDINIPTLPQRGLLPEEVGGMLCDDDGNIRTCLRGVLYRFILENDLGKPGGSFPLIQQVYQDVFREMVENGRLFLLQDGKVLVATRDKDCVLINVLRTEEPTTIRIFPDYPRDASPFIPTCSVEDGNGTIWVGTDGRGLCRVNMQEGILERCSDLVPYQHIMSMACDDMGNLWMSTISEIVRLDVANRIFSRYPLAGEASDLQFNPGAAIRLAGGSIAFGTNRGLLIINPRISSYTETGNLNFTSLMVGSERVLSGVTDIDKTSSIRLDRLHRDIAVGFDVIDFSGVKNQNFSYRMSGVDRGFVEAGSRKAAVYDNLPYGKHVFTLQAADSNASGSSREKRLVITVERPWWWCVPAQLIYLLLIGFGVWQLYRLLTRLYQGRIAIAAERREREQMERINNKNIEMFTNVAHEFRTPLTIISGAVGDLSGKVTGTAETGRLLGILNRNSKRLLKLVNQLLDFNKLENGLLHLSVGYADALPEIRGIADSFHFAARQKGMNFHVNVDSDKLLLPLDTDKFEKVLSNLLSNGIKYSMGGGEIEIAARMVDRATASTAMGRTLPFGEYLVVEVKDQGVGIPEPQLEAVFDRYYQIRDDKTRSIGGSGIGLYMTRQLVILHHGFIVAQNRTDVESGSVFRFVLPVDKEAYPEGEWGKEVPVRKDTASYAGEFILPAPVPASMPERKKILVIDDDMEMLYYLNTLLSPSFNVVTQYNALAGYNAVEKENPDLILSDVMMLDLDGFRLCQMIKENISICHIPVILLTAKSTTWDQITGLEAGANAYVTKPFEPQFLIALIRSQLDNVEKVKEAVRKGDDVKNIPESIVEKRDREFLESVYAIMEEELSNPELNIPLVLDRVHLGRTTFYNKIKSLTGEAPNEFFRRYKLNRAAAMIREGEVKLAGIAYDVGMTPSYLSRRFKEQFGVPPSEYLESLKN